MYPQFQNAVGTLYVNTNAYCMTFDPVKPRLEDRMTFNTSQIINTNIDLPTSGKVPQLNYLTNRAIPANHDALRESGHK